MASSKNVTSTTVLVGSGWGGGSSFRSGPFSINPATSPRWRNSSGISQRDNLAEGLKKKCFPSPVQTMHQGVPGTALLPTKIIHYKTETFSWNRDIRTVLGARLLTSFPSFV